MRFLLRRAIAKVKIARPSPARATAVPIPAFAPTDKLLDLSRESAGSDGKLLELDEVELIDVEMAEPIGIDNGAKAEKAVEVEDERVVVKGTELDLNVIDEDEYEKRSGCNSSCGDGASKDWTLGTEQSKVPAP